MTEEFDPDAYLRSQGVTTPVREADSTQNVSRETSSKQNVSRETSSNVSQPAAVSDFDPDQFLNEAKFGTTGQQALTIGEGLAHGLAGPVATAAEAGLTELGVPGLTPEDQAGRAQVNPGERTLSEAGGFGLGALAGTGEAAVVSKIGEGAAELAGLGRAVEGPGSTLYKIASTGVKGGAELAALQAGDEASKFINQDPNQTLGSAAINVGLSGLIGVGSGAFLGSLKPAAQAALDKLNITKLATDYMGETRFLQSNPDMVNGAVEELTGRMSEAENMRSVLSEVKPELIQKAVPEVTPNNQGLIDDQLNRINADMTDAITKADSSVKTKSAVPYISEDWSNWYNAVTAADTTFTDKFLATNKLKQNLESYAKWGLTEEGSAKADLGRKLSNLIRPLLEDNKVWGAAGDLQKTLNESVSNVINANKDLLSKVTSKEMGERAVDPSKLQSFFNQADKGRAGLKANAIRNYLDFTQKQADAINKAFNDTVPGFESPVASTLNPTPVLDHALNTPLSPGRTLAQMLNRKGASYLGRVAGEGAAGTLGGIAGALVGHPLLGAWTAEKIVGPVLSQLAKPFAESAINSTAMRTSFDYLGNAMKGDSILGSSVKALFKGTEIIPKHLLPSAETTDELKKNLATLDDPQAMLAVGGNIGHYLPAHGTAAATLAATAKNYLDGFKPKQSQLNSFDMKPPVSPADETAYNRALEIANQPLLVLQHVENGTLQSQDVQTLQTLFSGLHNSMISKLTDELINEKSQGHAVPFSKRQSLSLLMGTPLGSSMMPSTMQSIIAANGAQQNQNKQQAQARAANSPRATGVELKQVNKTNDLYATHAQSRETARLRS